MADDTDDNGDEKGEAHGPRECMACRGTGHVISNLGGTPSTITCPWCEGGGVRIPAIDAQASWLARSASDPAAPAPGEQPAGSGGSAAR